MAGVITDAHKYGLTDVYKHGLMDKHIRPYIIHTDQNGCIQIGAVQQKGSRTYTNRPFTYISTYILTKKTTNEMGRTDVYKYGPK